MFIILLNIINILLLFFILIIALNTKNEIFGGFTKEFWDSSNKFKNNNN